MDFSSTLVFAVLVCAAAVLLVRAASPPCRGAVADGSLTVRSRGCAPGFGSSATTVSEVATKTTEKTGKSEVLMGWLWQGVPQVDCDQRPGGVLTSVPLCGGRGSEYLTFRVSCGFFSPSGRTRTGFPSISA